MDVYGLYTGCDIIPGYQTGVLYVVERFGDSSLDTFAKASVSKALRMTDSIITKGGRSGLKNLVIPNETK